MTAAVLATISIAAAIEDAVIARQKDMKEIAASAKAIADMFREPGSYSSRAFKDAATTIGERAGDRLSEHFSRVKAAEGSRASDALDADYDRFIALAKDLRTYADALIVQANRHPEIMTADMRMKPGEPMGGGPLGTRVRNEADLTSMSAEHAFHLMLQTCSSCHARFRKSD